MDALGHVNNAVYFRYMESARIKALVGLGIDRLQFDGGIGVILQSAQARFRRPVVYPDTLVISSAVTDIQSDRFTLAHELASRAQSQVVALGHGVIVAYDYQRKAKAILPERWVAALRSVMRAETAARPSGF